MSFLCWLQNQTHYCRWDLTREERNHLPQPARHAYFDAAPHDNWHNHSSWFFLCHFGCSPTLLFWWLRHELSTFQTCFVFCFHLVFSAQLWQRQIHGYAYCQLCLHCAINLKQYILCAQTTLLTYLCLPLHYILTECRMFSYVFYIIGFSSTYLFFLSVNKIHTILSTRCTHFCGSKVTITVLVLGAQP